MIEIAFAQEAAEGVNNAFGGVDDGLRVMLDFINSIDDGFQSAIKFLIGTFTGNWD